jgi:hypothetical protein
VAVVVVVGLVIGEIPILVTEGGAEEDIFGIAIGGVVDIGPSDIVAVEIPGVVVAVVVGGEDKGDVAVMGDEGGDVAVMGDEGGDVAVSCCVSTDLPETDVEGEEEEEEFA